MNDVRFRSVLLSLVVLLIFIIGLALTCGSEGFGMPATGFKDIFYLRASRTYSACVIGALLSLSGALLQLLLRNPLADPYTLGISGGAAVGALLSSFFLPFSVLAVGMQFGSMLGAVASILLLFLMARRRLFAAPTMVEAPGIGLILTGVMIASGFGAIISLIDGKMRPLPFETMIDPVTKKLQTRRVDISSEGYECARRYMIRLERKDLDDPTRLASLAATVNLSPEAFKTRFLPST
jgi:ABC-type Fe3+-siderophore transport system permease subunit